MRASVVHLGKNPPAMQGPGHILGQEVPGEKWQPKPVWLPRETPWTEETNSFTVEGHRVGHMITHLQMK